MLLARTNRTNGAYRATSQFSRESSSEARRGGILTQRRRSLSDRGPFSQVGWARASQHSPRFVEHHREEPQDHDDHETATCWSGL
jgi:hypothetical protein